MMDVKGESDDSRSESTFGMTRVSRQISKAGDEIGNVGRRVFGKSDEISVGSARNKGSRPKDGNCTFQPKE